MPKYYKAVPKTFLNGIKATGLDPAKAGQPGGATSRAIMTRKPTELDRNHTWLGSKSQAIDYAQSWFDNRDPVIIKVVLPDNSFGITDRATSGFTTQLLIPQQYIFFQTAKGSHWQPISVYDGTNAFIYETDLSADESSDDEF